MAAKKKKATKRAPRAAKVPANKGAALVEAMQKRFAGKVTTLDREKQALAQIKEFIPTGIDVLDNYVLGRGGLPIGRMTEVFGEEGCGKTALLYRVLGCAQRMGGVAALLDAEYSFDEERARVHGIDQRSLVMAQPAYLEESLEMMKELLRNHKPKDGPLLIGLDSIASLNTKDGISLAAGESQVGGAARVLSDELRDLPRLLHAHRAHLFMVNQIRHKIGVRFGSNITTPGGNGPRFYSSVRLQFFGGKAIKNSNEEHIGKVVTIMAVKNRLTSPFLKARVRFDYESGYNNQWSTIEHAKRLKLIKPRDKKDKGKAGAHAYLEALEALDWEISTIGPMGLERDATEPVYEDDSSDDTDDTGED